MKFHLLILAAVLVWTLMVPPVPAAAADPAAIAPGSTVVFVAGDRSKRSIMMVDPAGGMPVLLADLPGAMDTQPAVGPKGQLAWIRQRGQKWELVENGRVVSGGEMHLSPAYKPDGTLVAAVSGPEETSIYAFTGSGRTLVVPGGQGGLVVSPTFSPDGSKVAYVSNQTDWAQIYVAPASGGSGTAITSAPTRHTDPDWSPTGEFIVFVAAETDIWLVRPNGQDLRQLTKNQGINRDPGFSPDGRMIVFSSDRDGRSQLYVMNLDGSGQRPLLPGLSSTQNLPVWTQARPTPVK